MVVLTRDSVTFLGLLVYSFIGYRRAKAAGQRGQYAPAHNPALATAYSEQHSTAYHSQTQPPVEAQDPYPPAYQAGAAGDYYQQQPMKPAHIV